MSELDEQLNVYIDEWRKQKHKEEDELKNLKERQIKRRVGLLLVNYCHEDDIN